MDRLAGRAMTPCAACNWHLHDVSLHGETCPNGHPVEIVGTYPPDRRGYRRCRACKRKSQRRYDAQHRVENRARWHRWSQRTHASPEAAPRRAKPGGRSVAVAGGARRLPPATTTRRIR